MGVNHGPLSIPGLEKCLCFSSMPCSNLNHGAANDLNNLVWRESIPCGVESCRNIVTVFAVDGGVCKLDETPV